MMQCSRTRFGVLASPSSVSAGEVTWAILWYDMLLAACCLLGASASWSFALSRVARQYGAGRPMNQFQFQLQLQLHAGKAGPKWGTELKVGHVLKPSSSPRTWIERILGLLALPPVAARQTRMELRKLPGEARPQNNNKWS